ncbi:hypothetical protein AGR13a_Cc110019 [Agrobacterium genomosp. 13 str. CFBP 6927]|uniref:Uncharacterized protein n=1 Tax=Agrobacterium genomosp. 13 str. CFBP 6927 TaxID=1183428 RepID=A0ABM9VA83_9HYPH|nr:hypothetical protein AGR13a_Cc110019 [Agrobacterium genomosp. 13 str. CFBP 6927]
MTEVDVPQNTACVDPAATSILTL